MSTIQNKDYLTQHQYKSPDNLQARIYLHRAYGTNSDSWTEWVFSQMNLQPGMRILELGCGTGALWREQGQRLPEDCQLVLSDLSRGMLRKTANDLELDIFAYQGDAQELPFGDDSFDGVAAHHMLYHVSDLTATLQEIHRVLKPGGWLVAATNGNQHMQALYDLLEETHTLFGLHSEIKHSDSAHLFGLESGIAPLNAVFGAVERVDFLQNLRVTDVQPLIDYIYSMWGTEIRDEAALRKRIQREIDETGCFFIGKSQGMLKARKEAT